MIRQSLKKIILNTYSKYFLLVLKIAKMAQKEVKISLSSYTVSAKQSVIIISNAWGSCSVISDTRPVQVQY